MQIMKVMGLRGGVQLLCLVHQHYGGNVHYGCCCRSLPQIRWFDEILRRSNTLPVSTGLLFVNDYDVVSINRRTML